MNDHIKAAVHKLEVPKPKESQWKKWLNVLYGTVFMLCLALLVGMMFGMGYAGFQIIKKWAE